MSTMISLGVGVGVAFALALDVTARGGALLRPGTKQSSISHLLAEYLKTNGEKIRSSLAEEAAARAQRKGAAANSSVGRAGIGAPSSKAVGRLAPKPFPPSPTPAPPRCWRRRGHVGPHREQPAAPVPSMGFFSEEADSDRQRGRLQDQDLRQIRAKTAPVKIKGV